MRIYKNCAHSSVPDCNIFKFTYAAIAEEEYNKVTIYVLEFFLQTNIEGENPIVKLTRSVELLLVESYLGKWKEYLRRDNSNQKHM